MDTHALHSKIPGIRTHEDELKDKYLEKMFSSNVYGVVPLSVQ